MQLQHPQRPDHVQVQADLNAKCDDGFDCTNDDKCNAQGECFGTESAAYCEDESLPAGDVPVCEERACVPSAATKGDGGCKLVRWRLGIWL